MNQINAGACFPSAQNTSIENRLFFVLFFHFSIDFYKYRQMDFYVFFTLILYLRVYLLNLRLHWLEGSISKDACQKTVSGLTEQFRFRRFYGELPNFGPSPQLIQIQRMKELHLKISFLGFLLLVHSFITFSFSYFNFYCCHQLSSHQNFLQVCGHRQIMYLTYKHQQTIFFRRFLWLLFFIFSKQ